MAKVVDYIIDEGEIEIDIPLSAHQTVYNRLGPGELFGEMALIDDHRRIGTARALTDTVMRVVTSGQILDRLQHSDDVIAFILRITLMRYRDLLHQLRRFNGIGQSRPSGHLCWKRRRSGPKGDLPAIGLQCHGCAPSGRMATTVTGIARTGGISRCPTESRTYLQN
jgi:hypothetical protein